MQNMYVILIFNLNVFALVFLHETESFRNGTYKCHSWNTNKRNISRESPSCRLIQPPHAQFYFKYRKSMSNILFYFSRLLIGKKIG